jgi:hypothetical protein
MELSSLAFGVLKRVDIPRIDDGLIIAHPLCSDEPVSKPLVLASAGQQGRPTLTEATTKRATGGPGVTAGLTGRVLPSKGQIVGIKMGSRCEASRSEYLGG